MRQIKTIAIKEFKDYFISPIAYIVISLFLIVTGWFFFSTFFIYGRADLRDFFSLLPIIFSGIKNRSLSRIVNIKQRAQPIIKAMIWLRVSDEAKSPIEQ